MTQRYLSSILLQKRGTLLGHCFEQRRAIPGTHTLHCFIPLSRKQVLTKTYSLSCTSRKERVTLVDMSCCTKRSKDLLQVHMMSSGGLQVYFKYPKRVNKYVLASSILMDNHNCLNILPDHTF